MYSQQKLFPDSKNAPDRAEDGPAWISRIRYRRKVRRHRDFDFSSAASVENHFWLPETRPQRGMFLTPNRSKNILTSFADTDVREPR